MRTLVDDRKSSQYKLRIGDAVPEERIGIEKETQLPESSFYDFAAIHDATFSGYAEMQNIEFIDNIKLSSY